MNDKDMFVLYNTVSDEDKNMSNGMRNTSKTPLTNLEIAFVKTEIKRLQADEKVFVFNDAKHINDSTCYNFIEDKIYITRNVFPDDKYISSHPRDTMSVGAVIAHEYYGHRPYREEYLSDLKKGIEFHTTPLWEDECRASLTAAHNAPGLTAIDKRDLVLDAVYRAKEFGQLIEMDDFMKEAVYGYKSNERDISRGYVQPKYVSAESVDRTVKSQEDRSEMPEMQQPSNNVRYFSR